MNSAALIGCVALGAGAVWSELRRRGPSRGLRVAASLLVAGMLGVLAWQPAPLIDPLSSITIATSPTGDPTYSALETTVRRLDPDAVVTLTGDGLDNDRLGLLTGRALRWTPPIEAVGLAELRWPHRMSLGDRIVIAGLLDVRDSTLIVLRHPDGRRDSVHTRDRFSFTATPSASATGAGSSRWAVSTTPSGCR